MECFGLTRIGYNNYLHEILKDDYCEPKTLAEPEEIVKNRFNFENWKSYAEVYNQLDHMLGPGDGYSYRSVERLSRQRQKGIVKPAGPLEMYRLPATCAQNIGDWKNDDLLKDTNWMKLHKHFGRRFSDMSKVKDTMRLNDPLGVF